MIKKYMVRCDMEGIGGIVSPVQADPNAVEYPAGREAFMAELIALCEGLLKGGAGEVFIYDEHYFGRNIDLFRLPKRVKAICGKPPYRSDWAGGLDASFAGVILLGYHSMAGTQGGLLHHTYEPDIKAIRLNHAAVGEIGVEAAIAGDFEVPVLMVTGDSAGVAEAEKLLPGVRGVVVKEALGADAAVCHPLLETTHRIRRAAEKVVRTPPRVRPYNVGTPAHLEVELNDGPYSDTVRRTYAALMSDKRTLSIHGRTVTAAWAEYWRIKLHALAVAGL